MRIFVEKSFAARVNPSNPAWNVLILAKEESLQERSFYLSICGSIFDSIMGFRAFRMLQLENYIPDVYDYIILYLNGMIFDVRHANGKAISVRLVDGCLLTFRDWLAAQYEIDQYDLFEALYSDIQISFTIDETLDESGS